MNAQPDEEPYDDASTWVPPEPVDIGTRPAWLPPGAMSPGHPYAEGHGAPPPTWPQGVPYGAPPPYGAQPYGTQPYGAQQPYGPQPGKPRMPRWAKVVLILGVVFYALALVGEMFDFVLLGR